jgi:hypothetical protein
VVVEAGGAVGDRNTRDVAVLTSYLIYIHMLCRLESFSLVDLWYVPLRRIFIG